MHLVCWRAAKRPYNTWEVELENGEEVEDKCNLCGALWGHCWKFALYSK